MDNLGKNWQSLIFYFVAIKYQRRLEIADPLNVPKPILARGTVPQRVKKRMAEWQLNFFY
jgi:hypothetical protein